MESTCVRTRTYVSGRVENVWSPHAYVRTRPRPPYGGYSPRTHAYARMTSPPCVRTQRHLHTQKLLTSFWREIQPTYARVCTHDVTPLRTYATPSAYAKTADVFWREIQHTYARVCTHDVIFPPYTSLPTPDGGYSTTTDILTTASHQLAIRKKLCLSKTS